MKIERNHILQHKLIGKFILICILTFVFSTLTISQTPQPTATPDDGVVKISTNLIQVDVTVTDKKGRVIKDLKPSDFEVFENGKKQDITNFSFIQARIPTKQEVKKQDEIDTIALPPVKIKSNQVRRTIAIVVDDLTLSFESMYHVRRALKKFVNTQMQEGDLVAILRTGGSIGVLQQFTNDKRELLMAIESLKWNSQGIGGIDAVEAIRDDIIANERENNETFSEEEEKKDSKDERFIPKQNTKTKRTTNTPNTRNSFKDSRNSITSNIILSSLDYIVRGLQTLPGRKSVMLLSDGLAFPTIDEINDDPNAAKFVEDMKKLADLAARSSVVFYTMEAKGLQTAGLTAKDNVGNLAIQEINDQLAFRRDRIRREQEGLRYLSDKTGGIAVVNSNDLGGGMRKMINDQSYYLIGYQPDEETFDSEKNRFNKLEVKVKRKNVKVRYRSGFFGISNENILLKKETKNLTPDQKIANALASPFASNEIDLRLNTLFKGEENGKWFLDSFLYIKTKDLKFVDDENGKKKVKFDMLAMSFGENGVPNDEIGKTHTITMGERTFEKIRNKGFIYFFRFPVKKSGAYQMRVVIRDYETQKVGSASQFVRIPKLNKKRLLLSGIALENLTYQQWKERLQSPQNGKVTIKSNPRSDTSLRQFRRGTVLRYGLEIYNAKLKNNQKPSLEIQTRIFYDGKLIFKGKKEPVNIQNQGFKNINTSSAINLGAKMQLGDYALQIIITDKLAKKKNQIATQFVQFELIE